MSSQSTDDLLPVQKRRRSNASFHRDSSMSANRGLMAEAACFISVALRDNASSAAAAATLGHCRLKNKVRAVAFSSLRRRLALEKSFILRVEPQWVRRARGASCLGRAEFSRPALFNRGRAICLPERWIQEEGNLVFASSPLPSPPPLPHRPPFALCFCPAAFLTR